jgi:hypothetical protein
VSSFVEASDWAIAYCRHVETYRKKTKYQAMRVTLAKKLDRFTPPTSAVSIDTKLQCGPSPACEEVAVAQTGESGYERSVEGKASRLELRQQEAGADYTKVENM